MDRKPPGRRVQIGAHRRHLWRLVVGCCLTLVVQLWGIHSSAYADGRRDLEDGIAFYENLDTERAIERLKAASRATDLDAPARAKAFLYLGMLLFETGDKPGADQAWHDAFSLRRTVEVPPGTSPKTIQAIERARASGSAAASETSTPAIEPALPDAQAGRVVAPRSSTSAVALAPVETAPPGGTTGEGAIPTWLLIGGIGAAVVGAAVAVIVVFAHSSGSGSGACSASGGGCITVNFN